MPEDSCFKQYWIHPTDQNVDTLYCEATWDWLLVQEPNCGNSQRAPLGISKMDEKKTYLESIRCRVDDDGYYSSSYADICPPSKGGLAEVPICKLETAIKLLVDRGYPASFVLLLDECWDVVEGMREMMLAGTGNSVCNMDILAWLIDPNEGSGFSPHRDRQPDDVASSFRSDGTPKYATCWLALSAAHCDNSCLYVIPKYMDPGYFKDDFTAIEASSSSSSSKGRGDVGSFSKTDLKETKLRGKKGSKERLIPSDEDIQCDPLAAALTGKESYQHIRALPLSAGGFVIFTHRIMHWGSKGRKTYKCSPRISLSVAFSDPTFEAPYFAEGDSLGLQRPPFSMRLALACAQMIVYYQRFSFSEGELLLFKKCFDRHAIAFQKDYRMKVLFEYSSAVVEIENARGSGSLPLQESRKGRSETCGSVGTECKNHEKEGNEQDEGEQEHEEEEEEDNVDNMDDDYEDGDENASITAIDDEDQPESNEEDDDEEDEEDDGFFLTNEDEKDDPMEHALQALLDIEAEANRAIVKKRSGNNLSGLRAENLKKSRNADINKNDTE